MEPTYSFADWLRAAIIDSKKSLRKISDECKAHGVDIHHSAIQKWSKGAPPPEDEQKICVLARVLEQDEENWLIIAHLEQMPLYMLGILVEYVAPVATWGDTKLLDLLDFIKSAYDKGSKLEQVQNDGWDYFGTLRERAQIGAEAALSWYNIFRAVYERRTGKTLTEPKMLSKQQRMKGLVLALSLVAGVPADSLYAFVRFHREGLPK